MVIESNNNNCRSSFQITSEFPQFLIAMILMMSNKSADLFLQEDDED
jgi:hypothetical protein